LAEAFTNFYHPGQMNLGFLKKKPSYSSITPLPDSFCDEIPGL